MPGPLRHCGLPSNGRAGTWMLTQLAIPTSAGTAGTAITRDNSWRGVDLLAERLGQTLIAAVYRA
jgi:hypothetical protein